MLQTRKEKKMNKTMPTIYWYIKNIRKNGYKTQKEHKLKIKVILDTKESSTWSSGEVVGKGGSKRSP